MRLRPWIENLLKTILIADVICLCSLDQIHDVIPGSIQIVLMIVLAYAITKIIHKYGSENKKSSIFFLRK